MCQLLMVVPVSDACMTEVHLDRLRCQLAFPKKDNIGDSIVISVSQGLLQVGVCLVAKLSPDLLGPQLGTDLHALGL